MTGVQTCALPILVVEMREKINVTESLMCEGKYSSIDPLKTPSVCSMKFRKAFLNISTESEALEREDIITGNRYPDNIDRVTCRRNWIKAIHEKRIKSSAEFQACNLVEVEKFNETPYDIMRRKLDSSRYDEIRRIFNKNYIDDSDW